MSAAKDVLKTLDVVVDTLPTVRKMLDVGSDKTDDVIKLVGAALDALIEGIDGTASPQETLLKIEALHRELMSNDALADAALDEKYLKT